MTSTLDRGSGPSAPTASTGPPHRPHSARNQARRRHHRGRAHPPRTSRSHHVVLARYHDPATAQFLTRDPLEALTRSAYGYAGGNPINFTDPTGLYWGEGVVDFFTGDGCGPHLDDALGSAWQWADDHSGDIALVASIAAYGIPGFNVLAFGFGAWSSYSNFREGHVLLGVVDLLGVSATGAALYYRAGTVSGRLGARAAVRSGQGYLEGPLLQYAGAQHLRYAQAGRASFAMGALGKALGL